MKRNFCECGCGEKAKLGKRFIHRHQCSMAGKRSHEIHPDLAKRMGKIGGPIGGKIGGKRTQELHPNLMSKISKKYHREHPDFAKRIGKIGGPKGGQKSVESRINKSTFIWKGVHFMSQTEMECAKKILSKPIVGVNCHIKIGFKTIDFFPQQDDKMFQGKFVECHLCKWKWKPVEEYKKDREEIIANSKYKETELVVLTKIPV